MNNKQLGDQFIKTIQGRVYVQCGQELDLMGNFTQYRICKKCVDKNHKKATEPTTTPVKLMRSMGIPVTIID